MRVAPYFDKIKSYTYQAFIRFIYIIRWRLQLPMYWQRGRWEILDSRSNLIVLKKLRKKLLVDKMNWIDLRSSYRGNYGQLNDNLRFY